MTISDLERLARGEHHDPFSLLGPHRSGKGWSVRAIVPDASAVHLLRDGGAEVRMERLHPDGVFEARVDELAPPDYRFRIEAESGERSTRDPFAFGTAFGDLDLHLMGEGTDARLWRKLGAHPVEMDGVQGIRFGVWAPTARRVSVVGDFNGWDGRRHPMRLHPGVGVWEIFVPELEPGAHYKYEILPQEGGPFLKTDPFAFQMELRPGTASIVHDLDRYEWSDQSWMEERDAERTLAGPLSVYEVHLGSWRRDGEGNWLDYREAADRLAEYVADAGFTHVELLPVMEHPYDPSWGYQVTGYFAPTSRFGTPDDFRYFVDRMHERGIGVILDWVPAHFPKDEAGLRRFDGTALYEHEDPRQGEHPDWGTLVFNFGRNEVRNFLLASALYWLDEFHIDGLRVDAVASMLYLDYSREEGQWIPNRYGGRENLEAIDFLRWANAEVRSRHPGALMIAEESTAWPGVTQPPENGGLGFHLKWNMGWMNDFLRFIEQDSVYRKYHMGLLTFSLMYAFSERFMLPLSHDEVVHGKRSLLSKMPGDEWQRFANLRLALGFMWTHPGKKLLFMGGELGEPREWSEERSLEWHRLDEPLAGGMHRFMRDLNRLYREEPALWSVDFSHTGFDWIDFHDTDNSVLSFLRRDADGRALIAVFNFTPIVREQYRVGVPEEGEYVELLNSDAESYGGSNQGNMGAVRTEETESHGRPCSLCLTLPPLGFVLLRRRA
jgi:1,4-alpha-glucan branching enzyme